MKKIVIGLLIILLLAGCTQNKEKQLAQECVTKMIAYDTYNKSEKNKDNLPIILEQYFTEEGYHQFVTEKIGYIYPEFLRLSKAEDTEKIKIKKIKTSKQKDSIRLICDVEYTIIYPHKKIKMKDTIVLRIDRNNKITEVLILNTSDIIGKMFLDMRIM